MNIEFGRNLIKKREFSEALDFFLKIKDNEKDKARVYFFLGLIYSELNNYKKSIENYEKCLELKPNSVQAIFNLAVEKQNIGKIHEAKSLYLKILDIDKKNIRIYFALYSLDPNFINTDYYKFVEGIEQNNKLDKYEKSLIYFLKSKKEKLIKNKKKEIKYLEEFHKYCFDQNKQTNEQSQFYYTNIINLLYDKISFKNFKKTNLKNLNPIFIIGLPRSGSTLIESLITSSNQNIPSVGESNFFNICMLNQIDKSLLVKKKRINNLIIDIEKSHEFILNKYNSLGVLNNRRFIDKSLENFFNVKLILQIFPNAKFIHSYRNYNDSVISIYQSYLDQLSWTHSIEDILDYVNQYIKIINYINKNYKNNLINIDLKKLTENQELFSKKIFEFCNLEWSDKILNFYKRKDLFIKTLSSSQIRNKIFRYDENKYKSYYYLLDNYKTKYSWIN